MEKSKLFDELDEKFEAVVRSHQTSMRSSRVGEGEITLSSTTAVIEARFDFDVLSRLHEPCFVGAERMTPKGDCYVIYEVTGLRPMHFEMVGMDLSMPKVIRKEYLQTIRDSWGSSDETWIDFTGVPTRYALRVEKEKPIFEKTKLAALTGAKVHILSPQTVEQFLSFDEGTDVGTLIGFELPLRVSMEDLVRFHSGFFAFTGTGKSNLVSTLIRKALHGTDDTRIVVFDVSGEYAINLADILLKGGDFYSTEDLSNADRLLDSLVIPDSLETRIKKDALKNFSRHLSGRARRLHLVPESSELTIDFLIRVLQGIVDKGESGATQATIALAKIKDYLIDECGYEPATNLNELKEDHKPTLVKALEEMSESVHGMSSIKKEIDAMIAQVKQSKSKDRKALLERKSLNPEALAQVVLSKEAERISVVYVPQPEMARLAVSRFIDKVLLLKKVGGARQRVLVVLDEAQEFIPQKTIKSDFTEASSRSVEALLRQGRKYRAHCWISTQRVAHLNVNALQQLHSYFASTLPRFWDRMVIADAFGLSYDILDTTTELDTGEWLFVSYKASKRKNVPAFIRTQDNEAIVAKALME
jgi:hypothetical protein